MTRILLLSAILFALSNCTGVPTGRKSPCAGQGIADGSYAAPGTGSVVSRNATDCAFHGF